MTRIFSLFVVFMLSGVLAFSQSRVVTGTVSDDRGNGIPNASVKVESSRGGTAATSEGVFSIKAKTGDILVISSGGYESKKVTVSSGSNFVVRLTPKTNETVTVISTGIGGKRNANSVGTSAVTLKPKDLLGGRAVNIQNGLTGKVSGANITTTNSGVFGDTRITFRGNRSLTGNNQPMLVVDGVPMSLGFLNSINPNDIESTTILKSASSTAIYGQDGVNGAIIITTKRGTKGSAPIITVSNTIQFEKVSFMPKFQTQFGGGSSVDLDGQGVYDPIENQGYGDAFDGSLRMLGRVGPNGEKFMTAYAARPNEKLNFFNTGTTNQTDVSIATQGFFLSAQKVDIKGTLPKDENHRISLRLNSTREITDKLSAAVNITYVQSKYDVNAGGSFGNGRDFLPYWNVINTPINVPVTQFKNWQTDYFSTPSGFYNDYYHNPYWAIDNFRQVGRSNDVLGSVEFNYKLSPAVNLTYRLGTTFTNSTSKATRGALNYSAFSKASGKNVAQSGDLVAAVLDNNSYSTRLNSEIFATYHKEVKKTKFDFLAGQSFRETSSNASGLSSTNLGIPSVFNISVRKGEPGVSESNAKTRLQGFFGKVNVGYDNWAYAELTGRYDMDSRLSNPTKYNPKDIGFFYPGANVAFVLTNAIPSLKSDFMPFVKVRAAISKTGSVNLGSYQLENVFSQTNGFPYGQLNGFSANDILRQSSYKPEFVLNKEVGIELAFWKNRINFEASAYQQENTDQVITAAYSAATGYPLSLLNAASFTNKGLEFDLKLTPLVNLGKVSVDFKVNYSLQDSKINSLIDGVDELAIGGTSGSYAITGKPAYTFKFTDYRRDDQGRVIIGSNGLPTADNNLKEFGRSLPKHLLGMTLGVTYMNFNLSATADYRGGNYIYSDIGSDLDFTGLSYRSGQNGRQRFLFPNSSIETSPGKYAPNTSVYTDGGYSFWSNAVNNDVESNYVTSAAFWKLRELALTYNFPREVFGRSKTFKGASISATGRNLITWLPKTNQWTDPEFSTGTGNSQGINSVGNNPPTRIFGFNVTLNF